MAVGPLHRSVRLADEEKKSLISLLRQQEETQTGRASRGSPRVGLPHGFRVIATIHHPGGNTQTFDLSVRDISRTGLAALHGGFLHTGTRIELVLVGRDNAALLRIKGSVVRCAHVQGTVHDVGLRFDAPAPLEPILPSLSTTDRLVAQGALMNLIDQVQREVREGADLAKIRKTVEVLQATLALETDAMQQPA